MLIRARTVERIGAGALSRTACVARAHRIVLLAMLASGCTGCVLGPDYVRPTVAVPASYRFAHGADVTALPGATLAAIPAWWHRFGDPELDALVSEGLLANRDLRVATSRVDEFAARVNATRAQGLPQVGYGASAGRQAAGDVVRGNYSTVLSASWELDLWGRIHRENEAARADLLTTEQARLGVALTLVSTIVSGYVTLLDFDRRLQIAEATVAGRKQNVDLFRIRLEGGAVSDFEMMQVTAEYETAASAIPDLRLAIAQQEDALSVLVGRNPGPIKRGRALQALDTPPVPAGLPSDLVARRPDILQAEQQLVAANARIGAARALYFPSLSLTGVGGSASTELDSLFTGPARTWSFVGQLLGPIFAGGAIKSANRQAEARRDQAVAIYEQTIQTAFRDVDDSLAAIQAKRDLVAALERQVAALKTALQLAVERYDNGYSNYIDVLDTERSLFSAQLSLTAAYGDRYRSLVDLYRGLGGDWIEQVAPLPVSQGGDTQSDSGATAASRSRVP
ncbi:MAG TPA: efflux transporter outer membrane subunit [Luteimonas sp.]|nr:efflux transporter outer membrane subunit [Luteimonas sp.]